MHDEINQGFRGQKDKGHQPKSVVKF
jgi:hypothetical protein